MYKEDWVNWTPEKCKQKIHIWQKTKDTLLFDLLLCKYDKYLLKLSWEYQKRLRELELREIYHTAILGFNSALIRFKLSAPSTLIIAVIKAYVRREIENKFISKRTEGTSESLDLQEDNTLVNREDILDAYFIINSECLSNEERELILLRFDQRLSLHQISRKLMICESWVSDKLKAVLKKVRKKLEEDGT